MNTVDHLPAGISYSPLPGSGRSNICLYVIATVDVDKTGGSESLCPPAEPPLRTHGEKMMQAICRNT
jgi:hypothetical protein